MAQIRTTATTDKDNREECGLWSIVLDESTVFSRVSEGVLFSLFNNHMFIPCVKLQCTSCPFNTDTWINESEPNV